MLFRWLIALIIIVPAIELLVLISIGQIIGFIWTIVLIVITGVSGAAFAKREALRVITDIRQTWQSRQIPGGPLLDAACVFAGGIFLITPGFITDILGFLLVLPQSRWYFRAWLIYLIKRAFTHRQLR